MPRRNGHRSWAARGLACAAVFAGFCALARAYASAPSGALRIVDNLYDVYSLSADDAWAVGAFGSIFRTRDGGKSWQTQASTTLEQLFGVAFADAQNGWVVGRTGIVLHTSNSGSTWESQTTGNDKHLFSVAAVDTQHAWVIGDWGAILTTGDGGKTWQDKSLDRDVILYSQSWPDPQHAWIVGEMGTILTTKDAGATWTDQHSGVEKTLFGIYFQDAQHGWACGLDGIVLHTDDGGDTWNVQRGDVQVNALEQVGVAEALENASLYDIAIAGKIGYAVGDIGGVFLSTDGGQTWQKKEVPGEWRLGWVRAVSLASSARGVFVGANGLAIRVVGDEIKTPGKD